MPGTLQGPRRRIHVLVRGAVQGVGFRPTAYRLARELGLGGWIRNSGAGVDMELEGPGGLLDGFLERLLEELPPHASVRSLATHPVDPLGETSFSILESAPESHPTVLVLPDLAPCVHCLREINDPGDRRHRYPFVNCTLCGPRYSILHTLPYDRQGTTMAGFPMCAECRAEYEDPTDRRFHAQPVACPRCGPRLELWDRTGRVLADSEEALQGAARALREGQIVAIKGLGGFQFLVDARDGAAVSRLRERKGREAKPLALMAPDLEWVGRACRVGPVEEGLLVSQASPIVLLERRDPFLVAEQVAPGTPRLGVMLPSTPLHHLLLKDLGFPVVATSGNVSEEPLCLEEGEALLRLGDIADLFLVHNRPIARPVDDSVTQVVSGEVQVLRRARGYAPLPVPLPESFPAPPPILAVGGHLKSAVALTVGRDIVLSQHLGDLQTLPSLRNFQQTLRGLACLFGFEPTRVACDLHPDYASSIHARGSGLPVLEVQHHEAHVYAGMLDAALEPPLLAVSWDGTGLGSDGTIWGGEFFLLEGSCRRVARLRPFRLPGGEAAIREPRRAALGLLHAMDPDLSAWGHLAPVQAFQPGELRVLQGMLDRGLQSPWTSSAGRLFDAVSALLGLCQCNLYEGQAAVQLEACLDGARPSGQPVPVRLHEGDVVEVDWAPLLRALLDGIREGQPCRHLSATFHLALAGAIVSVARRFGQERVLLTGGCFQNQNLTELSVDLLRQEGFEPFWHRNVPPNDGGLAAGQLYAVLCRRRIGEHD